MPLLNFIPLKDERSREYPAVVLLGSGQKKEPISKLWEFNLGAPLNQHVDGQCVKFALVHEAACEPTTGLEVTDGPALRSWIKRNYFEAQKIDPWQGGSYPDAHPHYEGTSLIAGAKIFQQRGLLNEYRWAFGEEDLALSVSNLGPAIIGVQWYEGMFKPDREGVIKPTGKVRGGHAIVVRGIDTQRDLYRLTNSWGGAWGINGDCFLSREDMDKLLKQEGESVIITSKDSFAHKAITDFN